MAEQERAENRQKCGLVMEGGAMRGMFTAGVTDVLMEEGITFDAGVGTSAGAAFGCNFVSKQPYRARRYVVRFCKDYRFCSLMSLILTGDLYGSEYGYHTIPENLDKFDYEAFEKNPMEFFCTATDVLTGQAVYHRFSDCRGDDALWLEGSASMPLVSRPKQVNGRALLDGGITDPSPLAFLEKQGYERNVVVLTRSLSYRKKPMKGMAAVSLALRKYPAIVRALETRHDLYNAQVRFIRQREAEGKAFVIRPFAEVNIGATCHDRAELKRVYGMGRQAATERMSALKEWMREGEDSIEKIR
ncbi:MAG: patatin family protein [Lachnospiraceae bacterium]|nr:patatin family protein [Lachnospiraceae bacterium]